MIELVTGLPGAGKTLHTIWRYKRLSEAENRPVYYHGISDLTLPWIPLADPQKWFEVEPNAIVIIDECQQVFRPAGPQNGVPPCIAQMETHRHAGIDLVLLTQQPMLVHRNVRELVGHHLHLVRVFGMHRSNVHEWDQCRDNPRTNRKDSRSSIWAYPREVFSYYKSAEVHTHKRAIPARVWFALIAFVAAIVLAIFGVRQLWSFVGKEGVERFAGTQVKTSSDSPAPSSGGSERVVNTAEWFDSRRPRVAGLPQTAPMYDEVTKPTAAPFPAACVAIRGGCRCYSQQGTRIDTPEELCREIVQGGYFVEWDTDKKRDQTGVSGRDSSADVSPGASSGAGIPAPPRPGFGSSPRGASVGVS